MDIILAYVMELSCLNNMSDLPLKGTLHMCSEIKASLKYIHKWLETYPTQKMWNKSNAEILN